MNYKAVDNTNYFQLHTVAEPEFQFRGGKIKKQ